MSFYKYLIPAFLWHLILFYLLLGRIPAPETDARIPFFDKIAHFCVFALLVFLYKWGFQKVKFQSGKNMNSSLWALFIGISFGGLTEILQGIFFEYRSGDIADFIANVFGCIIGVVSYNFLKKTYFVRFL
ncbi:MAG: VanZ family protein [Flammeovirgaceae bacterium]|nr:VanZ family protein [Flammeovirgaceae bacterium]